MAAGSPYISVNGVQYTYSRSLPSQRIFVNSLRIEDQQGEIPNTCAFTAMGFRPVEGQEVIVRLAAAGSAVRQFAGNIIRLSDVYLVDKPVNQAFHVDCIDYTWLLNKRKVIKKYTNQSATVIAQDLISTYCAGYTSVNVVGSLATIDEITFTNVDLTEALTRLAKRIGAYWYIDYFKDLHFFLSEAGSNPADLTPSNRSFADFRQTRDLSQIVTRVYVEGGGANLSAPAAVGATFLNLESTDWYETAGGTVVAGPQRITYTGKRQGRTWSTAWVTHTCPTGGSNTPFHVCWSPKLAIWVGVTTNAAFTSPDGITWTSRTMTSPQWCRVTWAPELELFCAIAQTDGGATGKMVSTSPDGITWTARTASFNTTWQGLCWAPALGLFVAVASSGATRVMTSPDGINWTNQTAAALDSWTGVCWSPELAMLVACGGASATQSIMTSTNGTAWTLQTAGNGQEKVDWSPQLGLFCAMGDNVKTSPNGTAWTARTQGNANNWRDIVWAAELGLWFACANGLPAGTNNVQTSPDGITWTASASATTGTWRQLGYSPQLGQVCLCQSASSPGIQTSDSVPYSQVTGIPASGAGSVLYAVKNGEPVNLLVTVNDAAAQTALAALVGGDGIQEDYIQDNRITKTEATARGTAHLARRSRTQVAIHYSCRDILTRSGRTIHVALPPPQNLTGDFTIQHVAISDFPEPASATQLPTYTVEASTEKFSLEDLLRMAGGGSQ